MLAIIRLYIFVSLAFYLSACGVGGVSTSDDCENPPPSRVAECEALKGTTDVSGNWFLKADVEFSQCDVLHNYQNIYSVTIDQVDGALEINSPFGTFDGSIEQDKLTWSGQYLDEHLGKYLTLKDVDVKVEDLSLSGSGGIEVRDSIAGDLVCQGTFTITGSAIVASGEAPVAPEILAFNLNEVTDTTAKVRWVDRSINEDNFIIERSLSEIDDFLVVSPVIANVESYDDTGLTANTVYYYRVKAINNQGDSDYSEVKSVTTIDTPIDSPLAPSDLLSTDIQSSTAEFSWADNSDNETGFNIERSAGLAQSFTQIGETVTGVTIFSDSGLESNSYYQYRVNAFNSAGTSDYSNTFNITTLDNPPSAPTTLLSSSQTDVSLQITWVDTADNESNYVVERSLLADSGFAVIATLGSDSVSFQDTQLVAQTTYYYRVKAKNSAGDSNYSNTLSVTTNAPPLVPPVTPTGFNVVASKTSLAIMLTWDDVANESNYEVERRTDITGSFERIITLGADAQTYTDSNILNKDTKYFYRVRATNTAGPSGYTDSLSAVSAHDADPVTNLNAVAASNGLSIDLSWDNPTNITSIEVKRGISAIGPFDLIATLTTDVSAYNDSDVDIGTTYYYQIVTINDVFPSPVTTFVTTPDVPLMPQNFSVDASIYSLFVDVAWIDGANETSYVIEVSTVNVDPFETTISISADESQANFALPNADTTYYVRMKAINAVGPSPYTAVSTIQSAHAAETVTNLGMVTTPNVTNITISWAASANALSYRVERSTSSNPAFTVIDGEFFNDGLSFVDPNVDPGTRYYYEVYAVNNVGENATQGTILTPSAPVPVTGFSVTPSLTATTASLVWNDQSNETNYEIEYGPVSGLPLSLTLTANTVTGTLANLTPDTPYRVRIRARNAVSASNYTAYTLFQSARVADVVTNFKGVSNTSGTAVSLSWETKLNATTYNIQRRVSTVTAYSNLLLDVSGSTSSFYDSSVEAGLTYYYRIQSVNSVGASGYQGSGAVIVNDLPTIPNTPGNVAVSVNIGALTTDIVVTWVDNATNESGYRIYGDYRATLLDKPFYILLDTVRGNTERYVNTVPTSSLPTSGYYCVKVEAYNAGGVSFSERCGTI